MIIGKYEQQHKNKYGDFNWYYISRKASFYGSVSMVVLNFSTVNCYEINNKLLADVLRL